MTLADDLRKTARRTYGVDLVDAELMFAAADRLEELEAGREVEREMLRNAAARIRQLEAEVSQLNALLHRVVGRKP